MTEKKKSPREMRFDRESKALLKNIEKRKQQLVEREKLKEQNNKEKEV